MSLISRFGTLLGLVAIIALFSILSPTGFAQPSNLINITQQMALLAIVALGVVFVMAVSEFDLSIGAIVSMAGITSVYLFGQGWGIMPTIAVTLAAGCRNADNRGSVDNGNRALPRQRCLGRSTTRQGNDGTQPPDLRASDLSHLI